MDATTTFHSSSEDKKKLIEWAKKSRMSLSTFCRTHLLNSGIDANLEEKENKRKQEAYFGY